MFTQGRHDSSRLLVVRSAPNELALSRYAFSVSKRIAKKAVMRNKIRRRLREALRSLPLIEGRDIVVVARLPATTTDFQTLRTELGKLLGRARVLAREASAPDSP